MSTIPESLWNAFNHAGQSSVFRYWDDLDETQQQALLEQARQIDLEELQQICGEVLSDTATQSSLDFGNLEPAPYLSWPHDDQSHQQWRKAREDGEAAIRADRVAAFTVAGGQGTRLGFDGPKGTFPITPVRESTLFQVLAEKILFVNRYYGSHIPWFIMTSELNHETTVAFFEEHAFFGLDPERVHFFRQGLMPAVDEQGTIILETPSRIAMSPDGHGGSLRALVRSGTIEQLEEEGRDIISYFQVDNPLVKAIDPAFIGFHLQEGSQLSSKMIPKAYPEEKVGHFCTRKDGKLCVVEYSDLPDELAKAKDGQGRLRFRSGSIAIHVMDRDFVKELGGDQTATKLPFHRAHKKVPHVDEQGNTQNPEEPNGYKFEMFVFDAIPFAHHPIVVETKREEEFSPVKNAEGKDSPQSCREELLRQYTRWLQHAGVEWPADDEGLPTTPIEISASFAMDDETFAEQWKALDPKPELSANAVIEPIE